MLLFVWLFVCLQEASPWSSPLLEEEEDEERGETGFVIYHLCVAQIKEILRCFFSVQLTVEALHRLAG